MSNHDYNTIWARIDILHFINSNWLINVFGNSTNSFENKNDISLFVQKQYLRTTFLESNIEVDIDLKKQYKKLKIYLIQIALEKQHQKITLILSLVIILY